MTREPLHVCVLEGLTPYDAALALQRELVSRRQAGAAPNTLLVLEHQEVITLGRNADPRFVIASSAELERLGIAVHRAERGGQATYHGPGQLVLYPIVDISQPGQGVANYVRRLEETMIRALRTLGFESGRRAGLTGVFCRGAKIGAIGVRVAGGVAFHGFALNIAPNLSRYKLIVPCGLAEVEMTSMAALRETAPTRKEAEDAVVSAFAEVFGCDPVRSE